MPQAPPPRPEGSAAASRKPACGASRADGRRTVEGIALRIFAVLLLCCAVCMAARPVCAAAPDMKRAQVLLDRLALLYEATEMKGFDAPDDGILDAVALRAFTHDSSPAAALLRHKGQEPELFAGDRAGFDVALRKNAACEIARYFLGRPASLADVEGEYLYGRARIAPRWCRARLEGMDPAGENRVRLRGGLLCETTSEDRIRKGGMDVLIERLPSAPLGWAVDSFVLTTE